MVFRREDQIKIKGGIPQGELITTLSFSGPTSHTGHSRPPVSPQCYHIQHLNPHNDNSTFTVAFVTACSLLLLILHRPTNNDTVDFK